MSQATLKINMAQFREKWRDYADNIRLGENIRTNNGAFITLDARAYEEWLNTFNIFYTKTVQELSNLLEYLKK